MLQFRPPSNNLILERHCLNFLSQEEVSKILKDVQNLPFEKATVIGSESEESKSVRKSKIKWIEPHEEWRWLYDRIMELIYVVNSEYFKLDILSAHEFIQYTEYYAENEGNYDWHVDTGSEIPASHRKISVTIQLSDPSEYEGGYLQLFNAHGHEEFLEDQKGLPYYLKNSPKGLGNATLFPSFWPHRVTKVTKGIRKSLVIWVGGCPFK